MTLAKVIAERGETQLHVAETEKYPHVTYFFNGGEEEPYEGEVRELVDSPRDVPTYDQKPEMSAREAADAFVRHWEEDSPVFGIINFANPDMVGHTGVIEAAVKAVETVDECLGRVIEAVHGTGGACIVIADHGNADEMLEEDGSPDTAHSLNPVPFVVTVEGARTRRRGHPRRRRADRARAARDRAAGRDDRPLAAGRRLRGADMPERASHPPGTISWTDLDDDRPGGRQGLLRRAVRLGVRGHGGRRGRDLLDGEAPTAATRRRDVRAAAPSDAEQGIPPHWNLYVTVEDVDATVGKVAEAGGQVLAEPFDVFDAGRMAVIADPSGAVLCLWQPGTNIGAEVVNEPGAMSWADLATTDAPAAQAFYTALLGWRFEQMSEEPPYWVIFNGERNQGGMTVPPPGVPSNWFPYFVVDDVEASQADGPGDGRHAVPGADRGPRRRRFALIADPQGAPFGILQGDMRRLRLAFQIPSVLEYRRYGNASADPRRACASRPATT